MPLLPHFVVHMRSGGVSCGTGRSYYLSPFNSLSDLDIKPAVVGINRSETMTMLYNKYVAASIGTIGNADNSICGSMYRCTTCGRQVEPGMKLFFSGLRVYPLTKA